MTGTVAQREAAIRAKLQDSMVKRAAEVVGVDIDARTVELAFSSEAEVERWFGIEILSHEPGACDLSRLNDGGALLDGHDWSKQRGVVERAWIDEDRKGRALVRFSKSAEGEALLQDVADRIKRHVSVGYRIRSYKITEDREGVDVITVTRWEPYEISIVPIPADTTVGVGRSAEAPTEERAAADAETADATADRADVPAPKEENHTRMNVKTLRDGQGNWVRAKVNDEGAIVEVLEVIERAGDAERAHSERGQSAERDRVRALTAAAGAVSNLPGVDDMLRSALENGDGIEKFQRALLDKLNERASTPINDQARGSDIGLSDREVRNFSVLKLARALSDPSDKRAQEAAAFEFEASRAAAERSGKDAGKVVIPTDVLRAPLNTGTGGNAANGATGGNLVATELLAGSFIEALRKRTTIMRNARVIGGLVGNIDIPKQLAAANGYWLGEDDDASETGIELGQIAMSPKTVAAYSEITRRMLMQSSLDAEALVRLDLAAALAKTIDVAGYYGTGTEHQPRGIANYTGIHAVEFAGVQPTFAELVAMETAIAMDDADVESMRYVGNAAFRGHCKTTTKFGAGTESTLWEPGGTVNGYGADITNQVNGGDLFFGNFADLLVAMWGGLELQVDPYTHSRKGRVRLVVFQDVDFALRRVESFALGRRAATP